MKRPSQVLAAPGKVISPAQLRAEKAKQFVRYLECCGAQARFVETRNSSELRADIVVFDVTVERPQILAYKINKTEPVAAIFPLADDCKRRLKSAAGGARKVRHLPVQRELVWSGWVKPSMGGAAR